MSPDNIPSETKCIHRAGCPKPDVCRQVGHCTSMTDAQLRDFRNMGEQRGEWKEPLTSKERSPLDKAFAEYWRTISNRNDLGPMLRGLMEDMFRAGWGACDANWQAACTGKHGSQANCAAGPAPETLTVGSNTMERLQNERLTWAMACPCSCAACERFHDLIRDMEDEPHEVKAECDHPRSEFLAKKGDAFEMRKCLDCTKTFRVRLACSKLQAECHDQGCPTHSPNAQKASEQPVDQWVQDGKVWDEQTLPPAPVMQARFCDYRGELVERDGKMVCPKCGNS